MASKSLKRWQILLVNRKMQTKTSGDTITHLSEWLKFKSLTLRSADTQVEKLEPSHMADGNTKWYNPWENSVPASYKASIWPSTPSTFTPRYLPKTNENIRPHKDIYVNSYSSTIHNHQKCDSTGEWIKNQGPVHTMECYPATRHKPLTCAVTWTNLRNTVLNDTLFIFLRLNHDLLNHPCQVWLLLNLSGVRFILVPQESPFSPCPHLCSPETCMSLLWCNDLTLSQ